MKLILLLFVLCQFSVADTGTPDPYTIAIRTRSNGEIHDEVFGRFSVNVWGDLNVSKQQWEEWRKAVNAAGRHIPVIPEFPEISKLAYIDEGVISFDPRRLQGDCTRLLPLAKSECNAEVGRRSSYSCTSGSQSGECGSYHPPLRVGKEVIVPTWAVSQGCAR